MSLLLSLSLMMMSPASETCFPEFLLQKKRPTHVVRTTGTTDVRFTSLEEAISTMNAATINWKENTIKECLPQWRDETVKKMISSWRDETVKKMISSWRDETVKKMMSSWRDETVKKMTPVWKKDYIENNLLTIAKKLASMGMDKGKIAAITKLDIEKVDSIFS